MINIVIILFLLYMTFLIFKTNKKKLDILGIISIWSSYIASFYIQSFIINIILSIVYLMYLGYLIVSDKSKVTLWLILVGSLLTLSFFNNYFFNQIPEYGVYYIFKLLPLSYFLLIPILILGSVYIKQVESNSFKYFYALFLLFLSINMPTSLSIRKNVLLKDKVFQVFKQYPKCQSINYFGKTKLSSCMFKPLDYNKNFEIRILYNIYYDKNGKLKLDNK